MSCDFCSRLNRLRSWTTRICLRRLTPFSRRVGTDDRHRWNAFQSMWKCSHWCAVLKLECGKIITSMRVSQKRHSYIVRASAESCIHVLPHYTLNHVPTNFWTAPLHCMSCTDSRLKGIGSPRNERPQLEGMYANVQIRKRGLVDDPVTKLLNRWASEHFFLIIW